MEDRGTHILLLKEEFNFLVNTIVELRDRVQKLEAENEQYKIRITELEAIIGKNSGNSHKPPSSDGYKKVIKNNREKTDRKQGAQVGHEGKTLKLVANPDKVITHQLKGHCKCGNDLGGLPIKDIQRRQVFDLPEKLFEVTEHRIEVKECLCGMVHKATCPVSGVTQYGDRIKGFAVYMNQYQFVPFDRLQEIMQDCFGMSISDGVLTKSNQVCYDQLKETEQSIRQSIIQNAVIHNDETGMRCDGKTQWIHSSSTQQHTHYSIQEKRGKVGIDKIGILNEYKGISVHDRWASYDKYNCTHALCNAHLLRELKSVHQEKGSVWAGHMISLLVMANTLKKDDELNAIAIRYIERQFYKITQLGILEEPPPIKSDKKKRGKVAKTKSLNLLEAFINRKEEIFRFIHNKEVPFDNNLAERDLRMVKLKQKISGCFRTLYGAEVFCRIRSYISTARKQGYSVLHAIEKALVGNPLILQIIPEQ